MEPPRFSCSCTNQCAKDFGELKSSRELKHGAFLPALKLLGFPP
jgi:hypothetical protein